MKKANHLIAPSMAAMLLGMGAPALAQDNDEEASQRTLSTVTVTATRQETSLQDTPIAVTAITAETFEDRGLSDISIVETFTPNLTFDTTAPVSGVSSGAVVFIRGVGQTDFQLTTEPGVGLYVDDVYVARSVGGVLDVLDLERVEVLRGPQGTLFGRNTIGGAIQLVSTRPSDEFNAKGEVTVGSRERIDIRGTVDVPLTDKLRSRVSFSSRNQDGFVEGALDDRDLGDVNRDSARVLLDWEPTDRFTAKFSLDGTRIREQNAASRLVGISLAAPGGTERTDFIFDQDSGSVLTEVTAIPPGPPTLTFLQNLFTDDDGNPVAAPGNPFSPFNASTIPGDLDATFATGPNGTELDVWGTSAILEYDFGFFKAKSVTAYRETDGFFNRDADNSPFAITETSNFDYRQEQFTQELQLFGSAFNDRLDWTGGLFFLKETGNDFLTVTLPAAFGTVNNFTEIDNTSFAAYAQGTFNITEDLRVTGGVRYTDDSKEYFVPENGGAVLNGFAGVFGAPGTFTQFFPNDVNNEADFDDVSFKGGIDYTFADGSLAYFSYSEGFKSGGFNTRYLVPVAEVVSFDPETVQSYEVGFKWQGFNNRVRTNTAAFFADYSDIQVVVSESGAPLNQNAGDAEIWGIESELTAILTDDLTLSGSIGYLNAEYTSIAALDPLVAADNQVQIDSDLPNTPEWSVSAVLDYKPKLTKDLDGIFHVDWGFKSDIENDAINSRFLFQEAHSIFNASAGVQHENGWTLIAFVDNLSDKRVIESGDSNFGIGFHEANFNRPREWGVRLRYDF